MARGRRYYTRTLLSVNKHVAAAMGDAVARLFRRAARSKAGSDKSVWGKIAKGVKWKVTAKGNAAVSTTHPASQLKEFGGMIHAGGPWSKPSKFKGGGKSGAKATKIPLALRGSRAWGRSISEDFSHLKFANDNASGQRLVAVPLAHFIRAERKRTRPAFYKARAKRGALARHHRAEFDELDASGEWPEELQFPERESFLQYFGIHNTVKNAIANAGLKDTVSRKGFGQFVSGATIVGQRHDKKNTEFMWVFVPEAYFKPDKWHPSRAEIRRAGRKAARRFFKKALKG